MSAGFTPGPWEACDPGDYGDFGGDSRVILGKDMRIAVVHWNAGDYRSENDANAHLIAAAPDLYDLLSWIAAFADVRSNDESKVFARVNRGALRTIRDKANALLDKAEGRSTHV